MRTESAAALVSVYVTLAAGVVSIGSPRFANRMAPAPLLRWIAPSPGPVIV
jgi:hypothetical protein